MHHEGCAQRINEKYGFTFTEKEIWNKNHNLKGECKVIADTKSTNGPSFDGVQKKTIHDEILIEDEIEVCMPKMFCFRYKFFITHWVTNKT